MKNREWGIVGLLVVVIVWMFIAVFAAEAAPLQQATETPTGTITPIPNIFGATSTAVPTFSNSMCAVGTPSGWGTVTPNPLWQMMCAACAVQAPSTSVPSATPYKYEMTATVQALTATYTPTATAATTPQPTGTPTNYLTYVGQTSPSCSYGWAGPDTGTVTCVQYGAGLRCDVTVRNYPPGDFCWRRSVTFSDSRGSGWYAYKIHIDGFSGGTYVNTGFPKQSGPNTYGTGALCSGAADNCVGIGSYVVDTTTAIGGGIGKTVEFTAAQHYNKTSIWDEVLYIYPWDGIPPTPSGITPTPVTGSYCGTVDGAQTTGFGWNGVQVGATACLDIGPWDWSDILPAWMTGALNLPDIPWIAHVCLQQVSIGSFEIFGVWIYIGVFIYLAGVVVVINIASRK